MTKRSVISQLASVGEGALGKLAQNPMTKGAYDSAMQLKERVEKVVKGLAELEERVTKLEQRVDAIAPQAPVSSAAAAPEAPPSGGSDAAVG